MYCQKCGALMDDGAQFCSQCGWPVVQCSVRESAQTNEVSSSKREKSDAMLVGMVENAACAEDGRTCQKRSWPKKKMKVLVGVVIALVLAGAIGAMALAASLASSESVYLPASDILYDTQGNPEEINFYSYDQFGNLVLAERLTNFNGVWEASATAVVGRQLDDRNVQTHYKSAYSQWELQEAELSMPLEDYFNDFDSFVDEKIYESPIPEGGSGSGLGEYRMDVSYDSKGAVQNATVSHVDSSERDIELAFQDERIASMIYELGTISYTYSSDENGDLMSSKLVVSDDFQSRLQIESYVQEVYRPSNSDEKGSVTTAITYIQNEFVPTDAGASSSKATVSFDENGCHALIEFEDGSYQQLTWAKIDVPNPLAASLNRMSLLSLIFE